MTWPLVALGDIAVIDRKVVGPADIADGTSYLGLEHIERGGRIVGGEVIGDFTVASAKFRFTAEHVLYGKLRPNLGKIARPERDGVCSTDILPVRPGPRVDRGYLAHYLAQPSMVDYAASRTSGANLPRLSPSELTCFEVPLPPIEEQRRIAAILDHADSLRARRHLALSATDRLAGALLAEACARGRWPTRPLSNLAATSSGGTPDRARADYYGGDIPWVKSGELHEGLVTRTEESLTSAGLASSSAKLLEPGAVLMAMYGATAGVVGELGMAAATNQAVCAIRVGPELMSSFFVGYLKSIKPALLAARSGGAQPNLSQTLIRGLQIPVPPYEVQLKFEERLDKLNTIRRHQVESQRSLQASFVALQARAFSGRL